MKSCLRSMFYTILGLRYPIKVSIEYEHAIHLLQHIGPSKDCSCFCQNKLSTDYDLHIIIPVYNASAYIVECLDSIFSQQSTYTFFVSIVNDGSTDDSARLLQEYIHQLEGTPFSGCVELIHQSNQGPANARNRALAHIRGRYLTFVDSDDKLMPGAINALMHAIISEEADIAEGKTQRGSAYGFPWGKVYKSELFQNLHFPSGYLFEDTINIFFLYPLSRKTIQVPGMHYFYRENPNSILHTFKGTTQVIDSLWVSKQVLEDYFSLGHAPTPQLFTDFLRDVTTTALHFKSLRNENYFQALFVIHQQMIIKYFATFRDELDRCSPQLRKIASALFSDNYRSYRTTINLCK